MIFLDRQTRPYLERLIRNQIIKSDKDFIAKRIIGMLEADWKRLEEVKNCKHKYGEYIDKKTCCIKCGDYGVDMGEEWTLKI